MNPLTEARQAELQRWSTLGLSTVDYVSVWPNGVYPRLRLHDDAQGNPDPLRLLIIVVVRVDGSKALVKFSDRCRESTESRPQVPRDVKGCRTMAPVFKVGDGVLGL